MKNRGGRLALLALFVVMFIVYFWFATGRTGNLFLPVKFFSTEGFFASQAHSILYGRLDVPPGHIGLEGMEWDGRCYGYFGVSPSIIRIITTAIFGDAGSNARIFVLIYCFGTLVLSSLLLMDFIRRAGIVLGKTGWALIVAYLLALGLGSVNLYMASAGTIYHEAMTCSCFFALLVFWLTLGYNRDNSPRKLAAALVLAYFSVNARQFAGTGALMVLTLVVAGKTLMALLPQGRALAFAQRFFSFWGVEAVPAAQEEEEKREPRPKSEILAKGLGVLLLIGIITFSPSAVLYAKFGTFNKLPMKHLFAYRLHPDRYERTKGELFSWYNFAPGAQSYFGLTGLRPASSFPWVEIVPASTEETLRRHPKALLDTREDSVPLPLHNPLLALLALAGIAWIFTPRAKARILRPAIAASLVSAFIVINFIFITHRYIFDFYPFILFSNIAGLLYVLRWKESRLRAALPVFILLALYSIAVNYMICYENSVKLAEIAKLY